MLKLFCIYLDTEELNAHSFVVTGFKFAVIWKKAFTIWGGICGTAIMGSS